MTRIRDGRRFFTPPPLKMVGDQSQLGFPIYLDKPMYMLIWKRP